MTPTTKPGRVQCKDLSDLELLDLIAENGRRIAAGHFDQPFPDEILAYRFPSKVILAKMERFSDRGWLDYGVSLRLAHLTEAGERMRLELLGDGLGHKFIYEDEISISSRSGWIVTPVTGLNPGRFYREAGAGGVARASAGESSAGKA